MSLRLHVARMPNVHVAAVALMVRGGPRFEGPAEGGLTHALEHMLFRGAGRHATAPALLEAFERTGDEPDAYTTDDALAVVLDVDPRRLEDALGLLRDLLLRPRYRDLERERAVILEERMGLVDARDVPTDMDDVARAVTFAGHPLARPVIGTARQVRRFDRRALEGLRRRLVRRGNVALAIAGPVDAARARRAGERLLRALPAGPGLEPAPLPPPAGPRTALIRTRGGSQVDLRLGFRAPGPREPAAAALAALADVLDGGSTGRVARRLVDQGLCYEAWAEPTAWADGALLELHVTLDPRNVGEAVARALALLDDLRRRGPTAAELELARVRRGHRARRAADDPRDRAERLARRLLLDLPLDLDAERARVDAVEPADVAALARDLFRPGRLTACMLGAPTPAARRAAREALAAWVARRS